MTTAGRDQEKVEGSTDVSQRLAVFTGRDSLMFNPNLNNESVQEKTDPHGLKMIKACGTIYKGNSSVGIFQLCFGEIIFQQNMKEKNIYVINYLLIVMNGGVICIINYYEMTTIVHF